jgi:hypothetical protein
MQSMLSFVMTAYLPYLMIRTDQQTTDCINVQTPYPLVLCALHVLYVANMHKLIISIWHLTVITPASSHQIIKDPVVTRMTYEVAACQRVLCILYGDNGYYLAQLRQVLLLNYETLYFNHHHIRFSSSIWLKSWLLFVSLVRNQQVNESSIYKNTVHISCLKFIFGIADISSFQLVGH